MKKNDLNLEKLFSLEHTAAAALLEKFRDEPWQALSHIGEFIEAYIRTLPEDEYLSPKPSVRIHKSAVISDSAYIEGPSVIGPGTCVRQAAFVRGRALVGKDCVVGNSTELKNVILFDHVEVPHFNYVGDSILGYRAHMGAGSITSNVRSDQALIRVHFEDGDLETGLRKFGVLLGDGVEVGCGSVLNPGCIVGAGSIIYPLTSVRGVVSSGVILKAAGESTPIL